VWCVQIQECMDWAFGDSLDHWVRVGEAFELIRFCMSSTMATWLAEKRKKGYHFMYHIQTPLKSTNIARMV
jgi:hypothetical protein